MAERVEVHVQDRRHQRPLGHAGRVLAHVAQAAVLFLDRREALQLQVREPQPGGDLEVLLPQAVAVGERAGEPVPRAEGQVHRDLDRIGGGLSQPRTRSSWS